MVIELISKVFQTPSVFERNSPRALAMSATGSKRLILLFIVSFLIACRLHSQSDKQEWGFMPPFFSRGKPTLQRLEGAGNSPPASPVRVNAEVVPKSRDSGI